MAPADQRFGAWLRRHPSLGARERRWLADRVYDVLRHGLAYDAFLQQPGRLDACLSTVLLPPAPGTEGARRAAAPHGGGARTATGTAAAAAADRAGKLALWQRVCALVLLSARCQAAGEALAPFGAAAAEPVPDGPGEGSGLATAWSQWRASQPVAVRCSLPDWLWQALLQGHGEQAEALAQALLRPAAIDIRCNLLKGKPKVLQARLAEAGIGATPVEGVATALRLAGRPALSRSPLFEAGWFELQDAGSQAIVDSCAVRRGERVVDFCAGAGGKTLALAARMRNQGQILAFDNDEARLARLAPRLQRAGVSIVSCMRIDGCQDARLSRYRGWADLVLVDAPCSGSGTLRRHPDLKWRLQPEELAGFQALQREILQAAVRLLRPGGRLVYATCSLLAQENSQQLAWFAQWQAGTPAGQGAAHPSAAPAAPALQLVSSRYWLPGADHGDAFFMSSWQAANSE